MEFKHLNDKNKTPTNKVVGRFIQNSVNCDSPFRFRPNISTPPSRFSKIRNPFEPNLMDRLHLPTFSPSVFAQASTPKNDDKFKWTIDEVSNLKPADIDESTIDMHVLEHDSAVESLVQEKIERFFSEKIIVPSPMVAHPIQRVPLLPIMEEEKQYCEASAQTVLTLPPILPPHVEDIFRPYFSYTQDQQQPEVNTESSLYKRLFECSSEEEKEYSIHLSPAGVCTSPVILSPLNPIINDNDPSFGSPSNIPELRECNLSPISRKSPRQSRSACRLSFSGNMSLDSSAMVVPDILQPVPNQSDYSDSSRPPSVHELLSDSTTNWDMEYKQVSLVTPDNSSDSDSNKMDISTVSTPHSKMFTSQRKRLSDSFKDEENLSEQRDKPHQSGEEVVTRRIKSRLFRNDSKDGYNVGRITMYGDTSAQTKLFKNDTTDDGYNTGGVTMYDEATMWRDDYLFASTPTKNKN